MTELKENSLCITETEKVCLYFFRNECYFFLHETERVSAGPLMLLLLQESC